MPKFGTSSKLNLQSCHEDLQKVLNLAIKYYDFSVIQGHRTQKDQTYAFDHGFSQAPWPTSKHNSTPSRAVDVCPYPLDWDDKEEFCFMLGVIEACAKRLGVELIYGKDWKTLQDYPHIQLKD